MTSLPFSLQAAIETRMESMNLHQLTEAREELSIRYRNPSASGLITTEAHRQAYVFSRMPATYAAVHSALQAIKERENLTVKSLLDLGAGPGTAMWAVCGNFPSLEKATLIERDSALAAIGKSLAAGSDDQAVRAANWIEADLEQINELPSHDLVILSYSIGELKPQAMLTLLDLCWKSAEKLLLIVEPGTPVGFERIRTIRSQLIAWGAHLAAPCPHQSACPMAGGDWCHFAARVERTSIHRKLKGGSLGYEDEKFSYIAASKTPVSLPQARILSQPMRHSGHVNLKLCTPEGVKHPIISKKMGETYKQARKADWGDAFTYQA